jgi:RNA polymerase sigma factor (sigma-70 family)
MENEVNLEEESFETLLAESWAPLVRFVNFRLPTRADSEDVLGQICLSAFQNFGTLHNKTAFKAWILRIATNACNDFYRQKARTLEIDWQDLFEDIPSQSRMGLVEQLVVRQTLDNLVDREKQILFLYYFKQKSVHEIATTLGIPKGTVKSRLFTARASFIEAYLDETKDGEMKKHNLPEVLPTYRIQRIDRTPFEVKWEELMGWLIVPKMGEKLIWGFYDYPDRKLSTWMELRVTGKAAVHGVEGVEIETDEHLVREVEKDPGGYRQRTLMAQLTETHCRILAETHIENGVKKLITFLDGDVFINNWGFGEDNCGNETDPRPQGLISRNGNVFTTNGRNQMTDVVGSYLVEMNGKNYETICLVDFEAYNNGVATEQFIDRNGRTVLWRRFNQDTWNLKPGQQRWSEKLPMNEKWLVNGLTYVHWYDCISNYVL